MLASGVVYVSDGCVSFISESFSLLVVSLLLNAARSFVPGEYVCLWCQCGRYSWYCRIAVPADLLGCAHEDVSGAFSVALHDDFAFEIYYSFLASTSLLRVFELIGSPTCSVRAFLRAIVRHHLPTHLLRFCRESSLGFHYLVALLLCHDSSAQHTVELIGSAPMRLHSHDIYAWWLYVLARCADERGGALVLHKSFINYISGAINRHLDA